MNAFQNETAVCPVCGEGGLLSRHGAQSIEYKGHTGSVPTMWHECDACGSEVAEPSDALANKRAVTAFRKDVDGLLTGEQIRAFRKRFYLSQEVAAALFGGGKVAFSRYEADDVAQSEAMDTLIRVCRELPACITKIAAMKGVELVEQVLAAVQREPCVSREVRPEDVKRLREVSRAQPRRTPIPPRLGKTTKVLEREWRDAA